MGTAKSKRKVLSDARIIRGMYELLAEKPTMYISLRDLAEKLGKGVTSTHKNLQRMSEEDPPMVYEVQRHYLPAAVYFPVIETIKSISKTFLADNPAPVIAEVMEGEVDAAK